MKKILEIRVEYTCDICEKRLHRPIKNCIVCKREICGYCRIILTNSIRKYPDSGYSRITKNLGVICKICSKKLLKIEI